MDEKNETWWICAVIILFFVGYILLCIDGYAGGQERIRKYGRGPIMRIVKDIGDCTQPTSNWESTFKGECGVIFVDGTRAVLDRPISIGDIFEHRTPGGCFPFEYYVRKDY